MGKVLVFGITGQAGHYLTKILLEAGHSVTGVIRRASTPNLSRISSFLNSIDLVEGDVTDFTSVNSLVRDIKPDYIYNLAAMSHVATSFEQPLYTIQATGISVINILEAIRNSGRNIRLAQASSSEMFGKNYDVRPTIEPNIKYKYQCETTNMMPQSPYAIAKLMGHHAVRLYRDAYNIFACGGIMFNYESVYRGDNFVTKKITKWIGEFVNWSEGHLLFTDTDFINYTDKNGVSYSFPKLRLGNLDAMRDWSHAEDTMRAFYKMLMVDTPDDYVFSSGETRSVRDFVDLAFEKAGILGNPMDYIVIDPKFYRPAEVDYLRGDSSKARFLLNWTPKYTFEQLVKEMVEFDIQKARGQRAKGCCITS